MGRASNEPEATLFGKQTGTSPGAPKLDVLSKDSQSKELAPDNQRTGKKEGEEALNSLVIPLNSGNLVDVLVVAPMNSGNLAMGNVVTMETSATQTDGVLPQRVDAYWHCCLLSTTVIDKPRTTAEVSEMACDVVERNLRLCSTTRAKMQH